MFVKPIEQATEPLQPASSNRPAMALSSSPKAAWPLASSAELENGLPGATVPTVVLDFNSIKIEMAACLANTLLGHVLFLKNQIPFPVVHMDRMPSSSTDCRSGKKRVDFAAAIDTLSSHLQTSFSALSNAFAQRSDAATCPSPQRADSTSESYFLATAQMAFVMGPSIGAPKARIVLVLDGLEVRPQDVSEDSEFVGNLNDRCDVPESEETDESLKEGAGLTPHDDGGVQDNDNESDATEPPRSRTPSPSPPSSSLSSPLSSPQPPQLSSTDLCFPSTSRNRQPLAPLTLQRSSPKSMAPRKQTNAQQQQVLRAAERLLARALTNTCAEDDGGLSAELSPTQTHVFLRAPRRFKHPAWIPRQNYTRSLDGTIQAFMDETMFKLSSDSPTKKKVPKSGVRTEGVWITCTSRLSDVASVKPVNGSTIKEQDELIWWEWNGKIVGFSDW